MAHIKKLVMKGFKSFAPKTELPFDKGMNVIVGPNGSGKSARWDTEVLLASGDKKPIGEIVEETLKKSKNAKTIDDGIITRENPSNIEILSINPKTLKLEKSKVKAFMKRDGEPNLYTIKTKTGKEVTTTACHPVMVYRNGKLVSEVVGNLKKGDFIATPNKIDFIEDNKKIEIPNVEKDKANSSEFARFLGYIVGDGCIIKNSRIDFVNAEENILKDYQNVVDFIGFKSSLASRKKTKAKNICLYSKELVNNLITFFNKNYKKEKKHIPSEILFGKKRLLKNFLAALFDCDSSVRKDNPTFEYVTMSEELANNVQTGLLRFGIVARKNKKIKYASNTKRKTKKPYFFILVEGKEKISKFYKKIPMRSSHKINLLKRWATNNATPNPNNDLLPLEANEQIKEIFQLLGIKIKPLRKKYPFLATYIENRCSPTKQGLIKLFPLIRNKLSILISDYKNLILNQDFLVNSMRNLNISGQEASKQIGLNKCIIIRDWASNKFNAKPENLKKFYSFIKLTLKKRLNNIKILLKVLTNLVYSDIFWDKIKKIEKSKGEEYVYDLEIEDNHNFVANNIFVHNSNIGDALCFVLGRLSFKSMRAAKSANLIFSGTKARKPESEGSVELIFDNSDKAFNLEDKEITITRKVRRNGQSVYKINDETKTRQEIVELLGTAGIDPHGFNIVLQGEIQRFVKMHSEERRNIIEEVAGISVYEARKSKALRELEKTDEKLKEVNAILKERTAYLKNLEQEKKQALRYKELEKTIRRCKASIIKKDMQEKQKELKEVNEKIDKIKSEIGSLREKEISSNKEISELEEQIKNINQKIQKAGGKDQDILHNEISELRAELAGLEVRQENFENQTDEIQRRNQELIKNIKQAENEIEQAKKGNKKVSDTELKEKKKKLEELEEQRKRFYSLKAENSSLNARLNDKKTSLQKNKNDSEFTLNQIENLSENLSVLELDKAKQIKETLDKEITELKQNKSKIQEEKVKFEKEIAVIEGEITNLDKIKGNINELDICPVCKTKVTKEHAKKVVEETNEEIQKLKNNIDSKKEKLNQDASQLENIEKELTEKSEKLVKINSDILKLENIEEKKNYLKKLKQEEKLLESEIEEFEKKKKNLEKKVEENKDVEEKYENLSLEVSELMRREEANMGMELSVKERELDRMRLIVKRNKRELNELKEKIKEIREEYEEKSEQLEIKEQQDKEQQERFQRLFDQRTELQDEIKKKEKSNFELQQEIRVNEEKINNFKISKAQIDAQKEALEIDLQDFKGVKSIKGSKDFLSKKLEKSKLILERLGSVNMRALQVYEDVKAEYDKIYEKTQKLQEEKEEILKIVEEIDMKKKRTFMKTFKAINEIFTRNFSQLSKKGKAFLEIENKQDVFSGGVNIVIRVSKGKYFDVTSLSGGEQTLVALSLIFAIQEYKPYCFYIFDEVDAALDKRNSERLAVLIKKHMKSGQYIIITHNDAIITESTKLYGVSMHEGLSKVLSLEV